MSILPAVAASSSIPEDTPNEYLCPITGGLMLDPVVASDGHTYERQAITEWLSKNRGKATSPMTNRVLKNQDLIPNVAIRKLILDHVSTMQQGKTKSVGLNQRRTRTRGNDSPVSAPSDRRRSTRLKLSDGGLSNGTP